MNIFWWALIVYALISLYEAGKTGKQYSHVWEANKPQFIILIVVTLILGGIKGLLDLATEVKEFFERIIDKLGRH